MKINGSIPIPEYLVRFIRWRYGIAEGESFNLDQNCAVAHFLKGVIQMQQLPGYDCDHDELEEKHSGELLFHTSDPLINYDMVALPNIAVNMLIRMLQFWMNETILFEVKSRLKRGIPAQHTLWSILLDEVQLDGIYSFDALEKAYKRHRKRKLIPPTEKIFESVIPRRELTLFDV